MNSRPAQSTPHVSTGQHHVYVHTSRPEWGRAVLFREDSVGRFYFFEDGVERRFGPSHEQTLLKTMVIPADEYDAMVKKLRIPAKVSAAKTGKTKAPKTAGTSTSKVVPTFEQQRSAFLEAYPLGFQDPAYVAQERGADVGDTKLKEGASARARRELSLDRLDGLLANGDFAEVFATAERLLTDAGGLLSYFDKAAFKKLPSESHAAFAKALHAMLRGEGRPMDELFDALVASLEPAEPTWTMVTALPALCDPERHLFVQPSFIVEQAQILGLPSGEKGKLDGARYLAFLDMAKVLRQRLSAAGLEPRDNLDLQTFVWKTLSKSGKSAKPAKAAKPAKSAAAKKAPVASA